MRLPLFLWKSESLEGVASGASLVPSKPGCGDVAQVQLALKQQGYYDGPLDGAYNDDVGAAMEAFLADHGLPPGIGDAEFCDALRNAQIKLSSDARSELNSRILGVNPFLGGVVLLLLGVVGWKYHKKQKGYTPNHGQSERF